MENLIERINEKLLSIGEDPQKVKPFMLEHLAKIETYLISLESDYNAALNTLKLKGCTISAISKKFNMSRTTLYNHDALLKRYIEATEALFITSSPIYQLDRLKAENKNMKKEIEMLYDRDITLEIQKQEIRELANRLKEKNKEVNRLENRNRELSSEVISLKCANKSVAKITKINQ